MIKKSGNLGWMGFESWYLELQKTMSNFFFSPKSLQDIEIKHIFSQKFDFTQFWRRTEAVGWLQHTWAKQSREAWFLNYKIRFRKNFLSKKPSEAEINCRQRRQTAWLAHCELIRRESANFYIDIFYNRCTINLKKLDVSRKCMYVCTRVSVKSVCILSLFCCTITLERLHQLLWNFA